MGSLRHGPAQDVRSETAQVPSIPALPPPVPQVPTPKNRRQVVQAEAGGVGCSVWVYLKIRVPPKNVSVLCRVVDKTRQLGWITLKLVDQPPNWCEASFFHSQHIPTRIRTQIRHLRSVLVDIPHLSHFLEDPSSKLWFSVWLPLPEFASFWTYFGEDHFSCQRKA